MKRHFSAAFLVITMASLVTFSGCANAPNNNAALAPTPTPEPTPDIAAIKTELTRIENDWPRIIKERDGATVRRIEADEVMIIYPDGTLGNKEQDAKDIEAGLFTFDSWDTLDVKVNVINNNLAIVTLHYEVKKAIVKSPDGKATKDISGQYLSLDTFARRNGQWQFIGLSSVKISPEVLAAQPKPSPSPTPAAAKPSVTPRSSPVPGSTPAARPSAPRPTPAARPSAPRPTPARVTATP